MQSQVRFNRVPEEGCGEGPEKVCFGAEPGQVQQGSGEGSEGFWCLGAELGQVLTRFGESSGEGLGGFGAARSGSTGFRRKFQRGFRDALVQSQVRFNRGSGEGCGEGPEKVCFGAEPGQVQQGSGEGSEGFGALVQSQVKLIGESSGKGSGEGFGRLWCSQGQV